MVYDEIQRVFFKLCDYVMPHPRDGKNPSHIHQIPKEGHVCTKIDLVISNINIYNVCYHAQRHSHFYRRVYFLYVRMFLNGSNARFCSKERLDVDLSTKESSSISLDTWFKNTRIPINYR